jgi:Sulfotransferase domain
MSDFASLLQDFQKNLTEKTEHGENVESQKRRRSPSRTDDSHPRQDIQNLSVVIDFLCIGAQKAGTTWLYEMLLKIPQVGLSKSKEVHFWDWNRWKGLGWYSRQFPRGSHLLKGEITPCYMALNERDIEEIHHLFPDARIIFIARDLVERAWSAIIMEHWNAARGLRPGEFGNDEMTTNAHNNSMKDKRFDLKLHDDDFYMTRLKSRTHTERSDYATSLARFLVHFPSDQIIVLNYKDISTEPYTFLGKVLTHIGVDNVPKALEHLSQSDLERRVNPSYAYKGSIPVSLRRKMEDYFRPYAIEFNNFLKVNFPNITWRIDEYDRSVSVKGEEINAE